MQESTAYGKQFGEALRSEATAFVSRSLQNSNIAVTELRSDNPEHGISAQLVREDAYLVGHMLVDHPVHEYFEDERAAPITALRAGQTTLYDLTRDPRLNKGHPAYRGRSQSTKGSGCSREGAGDGCAGPSGP